MTWDLKATRPGGSAVSVKDYAHIVSYDGVFKPAPYRGGNIVVPSRRGNTFASKEYDAYDFSVPLVLAGSTQAAAQDNIDSLRALVESSAAAITLTRIKPHASGDVTTTCSAHCSLSDVAMVNGLVNGRLLLDVTNLDGCWYGAAVAPTIPATITVAGTARTNRITLVLPGAGTLTNTTLGVSVAVTAAATLAVQSRTTTGTLAAITAAGDPFGNWFALAPGSNAITWSAGGTPTISYQPAYL